MGIPLGARVALAVSVPALAACGQGVTGQPSSVATAPFGRPVVSLLTPAAGHTQVVGGTPAMRARARAVLDGMGDVAIAEVRFGRAPASYGRFRDVKGPIWLSTIVRSRGTPFDRGLRQELASDGPLWQASVFENAYLGSQPGDQPRIRGTSESFLLPGGVRRFTSGTASIPEYDGPPLPEAAARTAIERAAAGARFQVVSISFIHPDRPAATVVVRALSRTRFRGRLLAFDQRISGLERRLGGLQSEIVDRCGYPVAIQSGGSWVSPRWLCPNPFVPGVQMTREACRKLPRGFPACASTG